MGDMKIAAYAKGATQMEPPTFKKINGLADNCWYVLEGKAKVFR